MIAIGIDYLNGWSMATDATDYERPEWPPHPARLFMSLVAAWGEALEPDPCERDALAWLETLPAPEIIVPPARPRSLVQHYVKVNDVKTTGVLPRTAQGRTFPAMVMGDDSVVWMCWPDADPNEPRRQALESILHRVARIGHSSSFVSLTFADGVPEDDGRWVPSDEGEIGLRVATTGLLNRLEEDFERGEWPIVGSWKSYSRAETFRKTPLHSLFEPEFLALRLREGAALDLTRTQMLTSALRNTVMSSAQDPLPEIISGHTAEGKASQRPHAAYIPLPFVDHEHADGHLMGLGIVMPREVAWNEREEGLRAIAQSLSGSPSPRIRLVLGKLGVWELEIEASEDPAWTLNPRCYSRTAHTWASVTPVVLDRFSEEETEQREIVARACTRIGLPLPAEVRVSRVSAFKASPPAWEFSPMRSGSSGPNRYHLHVWIRFEEAVRGPVLLGAGRYRGYGLCLPPRREHGRG